MAKFLRMPLRRYKRVIEELEGSDIFQALSDIVTFKMFPYAKVSGNEEGFPKDILGRMEEHDGALYVCYRMRGLAGEYSIDQRRLELPPELGVDSVGWLRRKLRVISTRNRLTYMILMGIVEHQAAFLKSDDLLKLKPFSQTMLTSWIRAKGYPWVDASMISRLVNNGASVLLPGGRRVLLKDFFPSRREIYKGFIKEIIAREGTELSLCRIDRLYTDKEIREELRREYGIDISRRSVSYCWTLLGIPPSSGRMHDHRYPPQWAYFSPYFPMSMPSVEANAPEASGIYELSLEAPTIAYPLMASGIFYIGSSKNIKKRLKAHLRSGSRNEDLATFIKGNRCLFRFIISDDGFRKEEGALLRCFAEAYGEQPKCNKIGG